MAPKTAFPPQERVRHRCAAVACGEWVEPRHLFCTVHWRLVPGFLQDELQRHFRFGQEHGKVKTSVQWQDAADRAIAAVAEREAAA